MESVFGGIKNSAVQGPEQLALGGPALRGEVGLDNPQRSHPTRAFCDLQCLYASSFTLGYSPQLIRLCCLLIS